jgi:hypothetical protein
MDVDDEVLLDCEQGRAMGCETFCCRLLVRLAPGERDPGGNHHPLRMCVDKDPRTGLCVYWDEASRRCTVWERRPKIFREYDCNRDPLLQVVLRYGFTSLTALASARPPPTEHGEVRRLPVLEDDEGRGS